MAENASFEFAARINPDSSMAMGFVDQQDNASGPAADRHLRRQLLGQDEQRQAGRLLRQRLHRPLLARHPGPVPVLNLPGQDPRRPDGEPFTERCQYMFRSNQLGTPSGIPAGATPTSTPTAAARPTSTTCSRAPPPPRRRRGTLRARSPPPTPPRTPRSPARAGSATSMPCSGCPAHRTPPRCTSATTAPASTPWTCPRFAPSRARTESRSRHRQQAVQAAVPGVRADRRLLRLDAHVPAAQDLQHEFLDNDDDDQGLERFITATRRQNFLVPPRRHRSFPLVELADPDARPRASARRASAAKTAAAAAPAPSASPSPSGGSHGDGGGGHGGASGGGGGHGGGDGGGHGGR